MQAWTPPRSGVVGVKAHRRDRTRGQLWGEEQKEARLAVILSPSAYFLEVPYSAPPPTPTHSLSPSDKNFFRL